MIFSKGDWLRPKEFSDGIFKVSTICNDEDGVEMYQTGYDEFYGPQGWYEDEVELWHPKVGEWCWVISFGAPLVLGRFSSKRLGVSQGFEYAIQEDPDRFYQICEPFIGQLPDYITNSKDTRCTQ